MPPPLAYQSARYRHVFAAQVVSAGSDSFRRRFDLKGAFSPSGDFPLDLRMHKLLGFRPHAGAPPLELLPVEGDRVVSASRSAAREEHPLAGFLALVRAGGTK